MPKSILLCTVFLMACQLQAQSKLDSINQMGFEHYQNNQFQKVIDLVHKSDSLNMQSFDLLGKTFVKTGLYPEAEAMYQKALEMNPSSLKSKNELASLYLKMDEKNKAIDLYKELVDFDPTNAYFHKRAAEVYKSIGDPVNALVHYSKANELNPKDIENTLDLSELLVDMQQLRAADSLIEDQLKNFPKQSVLLKTQF